MSSTEKPPYCNTGAQNTSVPALRSLVDWVSCTFTHDTTLHGIFDVLGLPQSLFTEMETGNKGYKRQLRFGHISVYYEGAANMGIHVEMSGQGCREFETLSLNDWSLFFHMVLTFGHFTRLDLAVDDFEGYFKISSLIRYIKRGQTRSKFKKAIRIESMKIEDGSSMGNTLYFGSPTSRIKVRFYDKLNERLQAGKTIEEGVTFWNRTEVELRDERADAVAIFMLERGMDAGNIVASLLKNYINFLNKGTDSNKGRWPIAEFWTRFLGDVEPLKIAPVAPDRTVERTHTWIDKQVSTSLAVLWSAYDFSTTWLTDFLDKGMENIGDREQAMIKSYKETKRKEAVMHTAPRPTHILV